VTAGLPAVADGRSRRWARAPRRDLATQARPVAGRWTGGHGPTSPSQRWHHRQPIGYDHGHRGGRGFATPTPVKGRQRPLCVDTLGLRRTVVVPAARVHDRAGATRLWEVLRPQGSRWRLLGAEGAAGGAWLAWVGALRPWRTVRWEIGKRPPGIKGFQRLPWRGIVERTFGWLGRSRRLSQDYASVTQTSEAMIRVAMIPLMVRRLARLTCF
jgi:putative transposase